MMVAPVRTPTVSRFLLVHLKIAEQLTGTPTQASGATKEKKQNRGCATSKINKKGDALRANRSASPTLIELAYSLGCTWRKRKKISYKLGAQWKYKRASGTTVPSHYLSFEPTLDPPNFSLDPLFKSRIQIRILNKFSKKYTEKMSKLSFFKNIQLQ